MTNNYDKVIRIQGDKLCSYLGYPKGTKVELDTIKQIASGKLGDIISIDGRYVTLSMHMIGVAKILLGKINGD